MADITKDELIRLIDGDTEVDSLGRRQRYSGINAREESSIKTDDYGNEYFSPTEVGAIEETRAIEQLIKEGNFIYKERTGNYDEYGREIIERYNENGEKLSEVAIASGIMLPNIYTDSAAINALNEAGLSRELGLEGTSFDALGEAVNDARFQYGIGFKTDALNEATYDPALHSGVMFRDHSRTLDNKAKGFWNQTGTAWGQGWLGVKEGFYGYLDAIGEVTDIEMIENMGDAGVIRAREQMRKAPEIILDYQQVDSIGTGFQYILNNAAMSAPYMVSTFGALVASVPVAAAATFVTGNPIVGAGAGIATASLPMAFVYAGQTWNEMEGDRGLNQFLTASAAGVTIGSLDRLGLKGLVSPTVNLYTKQGVDEVAKMLMAQNKKLINSGAPIPELTLAQARNQVMNATLKEQAALLKAYGNLDRASDFIKKYGKPFSKREVAISGLKGALRESGTEVAQELVQYGAAVGASSKAYDGEELLNRIINAGIAGGTLGGGLSSAGNIYNQGKNKIYQTGFQKMDQKRYSEVNQARMNTIDREGRVTSVEENHKIINERIDKETREGTYNPNASTIERKLEDKSTSEKTAKAILANEKLANMILNLSEDQLINAALLFDKSQTELEEIAAGRDVKKAEKNLELNKEVERDSESKEGKQNAKRKVEESKKALDKQKENQQKAKVELERRKTGASLTEDEANSVVDYIKESRKAEKTPSKKKEAKAKREGNTFANEAKKYSDSKKGIPNYFKNNKNLYDYFSSTVTGIKQLYQALEKRLGDINKILSDPNGRILLGMFSQYTTGSYHHGKGFRQFQDGVFAELTQYVDENKIAKLLGFKKASASNIEAISKRLRTFIESNTMRDLDIYLKKLRDNPDAEIEWTNKNYTLQEARAYGTAFLLYKKQAESILETLDATYFEETGIAKFFSSRMSRDWWYKSRGFDYNKVRKDKAGFIKWLIANDFDERAAQVLAENVAYKGEATFLENFSLVDGNYTFIPSFVDNEFKSLNGVDGYSDWTSDNMFEHINIMAKDTAKYATITKYFGHAGRKLDYLFTKMKENAVRPESGSKMTLEDVQQMAYYYKAGIDAAYGNYNPIQNPTYAALNRFLVTWSIFAGLSLASISSIPETAMVYYAVMDDDEWKAATNNLFKEFKNTFTDSLNQDVSDTTKILNQIGKGITKTTIVDRFATGERDISSIILHEKFFTLFGIKHITHFQRKAAAATAMDVIASRSRILQSAPIKKLKALGGNPNIEFDFNSFDQFEAEAYTMLADLGIDVEGYITAIMNMDMLSQNQLFNITDDSYREVDGYFVNLSPKQTAILDALKLKEIDKEKQDIISEFKDLQDFTKDQLETAIYRFVIERIQDPQSTNRPLFFQDPRYQLFTQFNGFISTFTAVVVPKLWNRYLLKGQPQVKYNTFALIVTMIALGGASQYLKDLIKFGLQGADSLGASPYINDKGNSTAAYVQRALYSSGVLGQGERVVDALYPLYPDRDDWLFNLLVGEAGPSARNISNLITGTGKVISATDADEVASGVNTMLKPVPLFSTFPDARRGITIGAKDYLTGQPVTWDKLFPN